MRETETVLAVCVDCLGWALYGPEDPHWEYSEGYSGPEEPLLSVLSHTHCVRGGQGEDEPRYSSRPCEGCGSGLAGDRVYVAGWAREESVL